MTPRGFGLTWPTPPNPERERFDFVWGRDGYEEALSFQLQTIGQYRAAVLHPTNYGMYRRELLQLYLAGKRVLREEGLTKRA